MKKLLIFGCFIPLYLLTLSSKLKAQTVASIDGKEISKDELLYAFNKNRDKSEPIILDSLENYLEQFINFKLKVREAKAEGYDDSEAFQQELSGYISQIRKPYLQSSETQNDLLKETYQRMQEDINASHILIKVPTNADPIDTLKAYSFLDSLRATISSKKDFEKLAKKYSQDGSAQRGGHLGWFTALQMVAPFEAMAYQTPENEVSKVTRTQFGYHLIYVSQRRPNQGKIKTSHIFLTKQRGNEEAFQRAQMVYDSLTNGADWNEMALLFSDDQGTRENGGALPWSSLKQLPDEFLDIAYTIEEKDHYTEPKETAFGWHIIRLDDKRPMEPYGTKKPEIEAALKRMGRNALQEEQVITKLKLENNFEFGPLKLDSLIYILSERPKSEIKNGIIPSLTLFQHGKKSIQISALLNTIPGDKIKFSPKQIEQFYRELEKSIIFNYEDSIAPSKYPEYGFLMKEYEEGLLLFEIMQEKVWNKAMTDTLGLKSFYEKNKKDYLVDERFNCIVVEVLNDTDTEQLTDFNPYNLSLDESLDSLQNWLKVNDLNELKIAKSKVLANEFSNFESVKSNLPQWVRPDNQRKLYWAIDYLEKGIQPLNEIKGIVMADYQEMLDQRWIRELRKSSKIKVNKRVLKEITST